MLKIYTLLFFSFSIFSIEAQSLDITSQFVIGSSGSDGLVAYASPNGDGYYLIGNSDGNTSFDKSENSRGGYDLWVVKTDNNFVKQWDKTYGGDQDDFVINSIVFDDRIVISTNSNSDISGDKNMNLWASTNVWTICIDLNGNLLWQYQYGGDGGETGGDVIELSDTSVLMSIATFSDISGNKTQNKYGANDIWLVEVAISDGHIIQQNNVGSTGDELFPKLVKSSTTNKIFMVALSSSGNIDNDKTDIGFLYNDIWLTEIDNNLNVIKDKCFGGDVFEEFPRISIDHNDNIIIGAKSNSGVTGNKTTPLITTYFAGYDCWILKVDTNFDITWQKSYGGTQNQAVTNIHSMPGGELVVNCVSYSNQGTGNKTSPYYGAGDGWLLILDNNGDEKLQISLGGSQYDGGQTQAHPTDPTKLIFSFSSSSGISGNKTVPAKGNSDTWLGILEYDATAGVASLLSDNNSIAAFPNPSNGSVSLKFNTLQETMKLSFTTVDGKKLETIELNEGTSSYFWNTNYKGVVFYTLNGENTQLQGKLVFE